MKKVNYSPIKNFTKNGIIYFEKHKYIFFTILIATIFTVIFSSIFITIKLNKEQKYKFNTLDSIKKYANFHPENYTLDLQDWAHPDFIDFYRKTLDESIFSELFTNKFFIKLGIKKKPVFNVQDFQNLLEKLTRSRLGKKRAPKTDKTINLNTGNKCIIFGSIHAALHSFVRDLSELERQRIIDNNLKIISDGTYFIILGDAINKAPYSLEILNILLLLIEQNPKKIIYLRGQQETNSYWRNFNTKTEIQYLFPQLAILNQKNNLLDKIDSFFNTLPYSVTINVNGSKQDQIICSPEERKNLNDNNNNNNNNNNNIKFMIISDKKFNLIRKPTGLEFLGYDYGIAKWATMSCQTTAYQKFLNFYNDAFLELTIGQSASKSILTLNARDNTKKSSTFKQFFYDPIFGQTLKQKINVETKNIYNLGSTMYLTGITAQIGNENKTGLETAFYFNNISNKNNLIKLTVLDDQYLANLAKQNIKILLNNYSINTIIMPTGTPTLLSYIDLIKSGKVSVFFPYSGSTEIKNKEMKNIIIFRPSYDSEIISMIKHLTKEYQIRKFGLFYTSDSYGIPVAQEANKELKKIGINEWLDLPHTRTQPNFEKMTKQIIEYMPNAIACISVQFLIEELINQLTPEFFSNTILFSLSAMNGESFEKFLKNRGITQVLSSVVPDPASSDMQIAKEFRENMKARGLTISLNSFEGYINGSLIAEAINNIKPPVTKEKIMQYFENMKNYKFKGLELTFNPQTRDLSQPIWVRTLENKWLKYQY